MLLDGHQLHGVVTRVFDPAEGFVRELPVGADMAVLLGHTDMRLIDHRGIRALPAVEVPVRPFKRLVRHPDLAAEGFAGHIHDAAGDPGGNPLEAGTLAADHELDKLPVLQGVPAVQRDFPYAAADVMQRRVPFVPVVEITGEPGSVRPRQPFPENPAGFRTVETEVAVAVGKIRQGTVAGQMPAAVIIPVHMHPDFSAVRGETRFFFHQEP